MADTQIVNSEVAAGESPYVLAPSVEVTLKAVNADFTDNGATAAWLPAVLVTSDSGHTIALAVDTAVEVAAGSDASVSFFPGVKHAGGASATTADEYATTQAVDVFGLANNGLWTGGFSSPPTVDAAALYDGVFVSDGTVDAFVAYRFNFGPTGSVWGWNMLYYTGPDYGRIWGYLASVPESDPASGISPSDGVLQSIDTLNYILAFKVEGYTAGLVRNNRKRTGVVRPAGNPFVSNTFRLLGQPGDPFTSVGFDNTLNVSTIDGGPGPYALKLQAVDKNGASTAYKIGLQPFSANRNDWEWA